VVAQRGAHEARRAIGRDGFAKELAGVLRRGGAPSSRPRHHAASARGLVGGPAPRDLLGPAVRDLDLAGGEGGLGPPQGTLGSQGAEAHVHPREPARTRA
jgi:hypothetical protein